MSPYSEDADRCVGTIRHNPLSAIDCLMHEMGTAAGAKSQPSLLDSGMASTFTGVALETEGHSCPICKTVMIGFIHSRSNKVGHLQNRERGRQFLFEREIRPCPPSFLIELVLHTIKD